MKHLYFLLAFCLYFTAQAQRTNLEDHIQNITNRSEHLKDAPLTVYLNNQLVQKLDEYEVELDQLRMRIELTDDHDQEKDHVVIRINAKAYKVEPEKIPQ